MVTELEKECPKLKAKKTSEPGIFWSEGPWPHEIPFPLG
jgi:hypothetical protein